MFRAWGNQNQKPALKSVYFKTIRIFKLLRVNEYMYDFAIYIYIYIYILYIYIYIYIMEK